MPIYEYRCQDCGELTEMLQRFDDPPLESCPECGGAVKKLISAPAFQFKGSGWYVTDYARSSADGAGDDGVSPPKAGGSDSGASKSGGSETKGSESGASATPSGGSAAGKGSKSAAGGEASGAKATDKGGKTAAAGSA